MVRSAKKPTDPTQSLFFEWGDLKKGVDSLSHNLTGQAPQNLCQRQLPEDEADCEDNTNPFTWA